MKTNFNDFQLDSYLIEDLYQNKNRTLSEIGKRFNCSTDKVIESITEKGRINYEQQIKNPTVYSQLKNFIETEIDPYCNSTLMPVLDTFKLFRWKEYTVAKNIRTTEYEFNFTPSRYGMSGFGASISFFVVEEKDTKVIIDCYFELNIFGYNYKKIAGKDHAKLITDITDHNLKQMFNLSRLSEDKKIEMYIDQINIDIIRKIAKKNIQGMVGDIDSASDEDVREALKEFIYEDETYSTPIKKSVLAQAKKLGITV